MSTDYPNILVTGAHGFVGSNLCMHLHYSGDYEVFKIGRKDTRETLHKYLDQADFIFHLAGANRPEDDAEFEAVNVAFFNDILTYLTAKNKAVPIALSSSVQAEGRSLYGESKRKAEELLIEYAERMKVPSYIYRFPNLFGKWCRPHYNSVVATYAHNVSRKKDLVVNDPAHAITLGYIDDVVKNLTSHLVKNRAQHGAVFCEMEPTFEIRLGRLAEIFKSFEHDRELSILPDFSDPLLKRLYATYVAALPTDQLAKGVELKVDNRGQLFELVKSNNSGQIFISTTKPGVTRGNHFHHTKVEKFCVVQGEAVVKFSHMITGETFDVPLSSESIQVLDIPPGYTHNITNVGREDMLVIFWSNEIFEPERPDTFYSEII